MGLAVGLLATVLGIAPVAKPRLVIVITLDECRADYLERYHTHLIGGFGKLPGAAAGCR